MSRLRDPEYMLKTLILGNIGVGKSSLMERIAYPLKSFDQNIPSTIGLEFATHKVFINHDDENIDKSIYENPFETLHTHPKLSRSTLTRVNNCKYKLQIWDCAGHPKFFSIVQSYFRGAQIIMYVFDITKRETFDALNEWHNAVIKQSNTQHVSIVVGNKVDLSSKRKVSTEEGEKFAHCINALYKETSAKDFTQVGPLFKQPVEKIDFLHHQGLFELEKVKEDQTVQFTKMDNDAEVAGCGKCL